ncbi:MAG: VCBS repeat-containing protein, partial [Acidobacteriota bacterium]
LESLTECAGGSCLPPTTFEWSKPSPSIDPYGFGTPFGFDFGQEPRSFVDVNGDGRADYCRLLGDGPTARLSCALASVNGFDGEFSSPAPFDFGYPEVRRFADVNGDGRADYCRTVGNPPDVFLSCALAGDTGFGHYDFNSEPGIFIGREAPHRRDFADVNGDGRADFCRTLGVSIDVLSCLPAGETGFTAAEIQSATTFSFDFGFQNFPRQFVDIDGDGQAEYCRAVGTSPNLTLTCAGYKNGDFWDSTFTSPPGFDFGLATEPRQFVDANGDGLADFCRTVGVGPDFSVSCALSTGDGFGPVEVSSAAGIDLGYSDKPRLFMDANGDGRADFCRFVGSGPIFFSCAAGREDGFGSHQFSAPSTVSTDVGYAGVRGFARAARGAGTGFCRMVGQPGNLALSCTAMAPQGHQIERIVEGYGQRIDITYASLDDPWVYTPGTGAAYPQRDVRGGAKKVVMSYTRSSAASTGLGAFSYTYGYTYAGARTSADGRGWLGFREIVRRDHDLGVVTVSHLLQDFPFTGMTQADSLFCDPLYGKDPACTAYSLIHRRSQSYVTRQPFSGVTEVLRHHQLVEAFEYGAPGLSALELFEYDAYGNIVREQRTSSVHGGESSDLFVHRQYFNDPSRN